MKTIGATKFKEQCLALLESLDREGLVVTKHGRPVAWVLPYEERCGRLIGSLKGLIKVRGDIMSTGEHWDADAQP